MSDAYDYARAVSRNRGFVSSEEQDVLQRSHVAIAGVGGDGGLLAIQLARLGVGKFTIADPEVFEVENLNRQAGASVETIDRNKAAVIGETLRSISPEASVRVFENGVTPSNVDDFFAGVDLLIDETEITTPEIAVLLAQRAREQKISNMTVLNIGFACLATSFVPGGRTLEEMLGLDGGGKDIDLRRWLPYIPPYASLALLRGFATGEHPAPSVAPGVALAASVGATQAYLHLVGGTGSSVRPSPVTAPHALVLDALTGKAKRLRMSKWTHWGHIAAIALRERSSSRPR